MLDVKGLKAYYGQTQALHDIDFSLAQGGITTLLGANGSGKTTTLRALCGLVRSEGSVMLGGKPIVGMATEDIVRLGVAHVPEGRGTFIGLSVEENLRIAAYTRGTRPASHAISRWCSNISRASRSGCSSRPARSRAASSRCWRSAGR